MRDNNTDPGDRETTSLSFQPGSGKCSDTVFGPERRCSRRNQKQVNVSISFNYEVSGKTCTQKTASKTFLLEVFIMS